MRHRRHHPISRAISSLQYAARAALVGCTAQTQRIPSVLISLLNAKSPACNGCTAMVPSRTQLACISHESVDCNATPIAIAYHHLHQMYRHLRALHVLKCQKHALNARSMPIACELRAVTARAPTCQNFAPVFARFLLTANRLHQRPLYQSPHYLPHRNRCNHHLPLAQKRAHESRLPSTSADKINAPPA